MPVEGIRIRQEELGEIAGLEREISVKQKRVEELKSNLFPLLRAGVPIEPGRFDVRLDKRFGRSVPWKQLVINELGAEAADGYKSQFPVHIWFEVVVVEHAVPPLWKESAGEISGGE